MTTKELEDKTHKIPTNKKGIFALVDRDDYERLWHLRHRKWSLSNMGYPTIICNNPDFHDFGNQKGITIHRYILGMPMYDPRIVDHINGDPLDNRRCNLRVCNRKQNAWNCKPKKNKTGYPGVSWNEETKKWRSAMWINGKRTALGYFETAKEAGQAYEARVLEIRGEYSYSMSRKRI